MTYIHNSIPNTQPLNNNTNLGFNGVNSKVVIEGEGGGNQVQLGLNHTTI